MHRIRSSRFIGAMVVGLMAGIPALSARTSFLQSPPAADNSKVNKQAGSTADQQSNTKSDLDLTKRIRQELLKDKSLSSYAHNAKLITQDGVVTLKGPVRSTAEKQLVEDIAVQVAGTGKVTNQLTIKTAKK